MKVVLISFTLIMISNTLTANATKVVTYKNCSALNSIYPGGVALPGAVNKGGTTRYAPKFSKSLYRANQKSDRDRDGIACEK